MIDHGPLRKNQQQAAEVARSIVNGVEPRRIITANVTPGGGKTLMASVFAHELAAGGAIDRICVVCPRDTLRSQVAQGFTDRQRNLPLELVPERNGRLDTRQLLDPSGYVTTYQSIDAAVARHLRRWEGHRWLLVLDEPHHMADDENARWRESIQPLVERARLVLLMSGTLFRHDRRRIPFVEYNDIGAPIAQIVYTRADALREQAVLQLDITRYDGFVTYEHRAAELSASLSTALQKEQPRALKTALLNDEYADEMTLRALSDWDVYRTQVYPSRALVVCHTQKEAMRLSRIVGGHFRQAEVALAISDDKQSAKRIRAFREHRFGDVLVTVGMAYEGLDVPDCTHLVCLTDIRSPSWLDQCFARVTRFNPTARLAWEKQLAYVHVPDDLRMREYISNMAAEQLAAMGDKAKGGQAAVIRPRSTFRPGSAELTDERFGFEDGFFSEEENAIVRRLIADHPFMVNAPHQEKLKFARAIYGTLSKPNGNGAHGSPVPQQQA